MIYSEDEFSVMIINSPNTIAGGHVVRNGSGFDFEQGLIPQLVPWTQYYCRGSRHERIYGGLRVQTPRMIVTVKQLLNNTWDVMVPWLSRLLSTGGSWVRLPLYSRHIGTLGKSFTCSCLCASA